VKGAHINHVPSGVCMPFLTVYNNNLCCLLFDYLFKTENQHFAKHYVHNDNHIRRCYVTCFGT
jgi:hypothetical protein